MIAYTQQIAIQYAEYGVRANVILPGLMNTPMAVDTRARAWGKTRDEIVAMRDARVPLRRQDGQRLGRRQRRPLPRLRRGELHHRRRPPRRRRLPSPRSAGENGVRHHFLDLQPLLAHGVVGAEVGGVPSKTMLPWPMT